MIGPDGQTATYSYDERDSLIAIDNSDGLTARYTYDDRGNLAREVYDVGDGTGEHAVDYAYDGLIRLRRVTRYSAWPDTSQTEVTEYHYDLNGQLTDVAPAP